MLSKRKTILKVSLTGCLFVAGAACTPPIQRQVEFCDLDIDDFTPALVAQIRNNPNFDRNLLIWLEQCPEQALALADFETASIALAPFVFEDNGDGNDGDNGDGDNGNGDGDNGDGDNGNGDDGDGNGDDGDGNGDDGDGNGDDGDGDGADGFTPPGKGGARPNTEGNNTPGNGGTPPSQRNGG